MKNQISLFDDIEIEQPLTDDRKGRYSLINTNKINGATYTPTAMASFLAREICNIYKCKGKTTIKILDPAIGDGELIFALLNNIPENQHSKVHIIGFEIDKTIISNTLKRILEAFPSVKINIYPFDFVNQIFEPDNAVKECDKFDYIIANPPYIRTQIIGAGKSQLLSKKLGISGKTDLYYAFLLLARNLLNDNGVAGFITSNKFMSVKSGTDIRTELIKRTKLYKIIDFGDTKLFDAAVLPCIILFTKGTTNPDDVGFSSIYQTNKNDSYIAADDIFSALQQNSVIKTPDNKYYTVKCGNLNCDKNNSNVWSLSTSNTELWLSRVENKTWATFSDIGKIKVGIKTTADNVFIKESWDEFSAENQPELLFPLITHRNAGQIIPSFNNLWKVLYTHEIINGRKSAINIEKYPNSLKYLLQHKTQLSSREYIKKAKRQWYEIWVPQNPASWKNKKIVFRDISEKPQFWLDTTGAIVNGDCYWIDVYNDVDEDILLLALAIANSTFIETFYDVKFNNKLYSGKRRYMTQYVEQFPLPNPNTEKARKAVSLVREILKFSFKSDEPSYNEIKNELDKLIVDIFV